MANMVNLKRTLLVIIITMMVTLGSVAGFVFVHELYIDKLHEQFLLGVDDGYAMYEHNINNDMVNWQLEEFDRIYVEHPELFTSSCN